jgi:hypothetical protein
VGEGKNENASKGPDDHAAEQKTSNHVSNPLVAGETKKVTGIMHEFVHIHA